MTHKINDLLQEFKQRKVFRVGAVYSGFAFIIFQLIDATFELMQIPTWVGQYTVLVLILGFPIATGLAWAFDITENGLVRAKDKPEGAVSKKPLVGNRSLVIISAVAIVMALWGWLGDSASETQRFESIAVLPLDNYMGDSQQDYFVDGMTEAVIAELARLEGLRVISRTSTMRFRNSDMSIPEIAASLGVDAIVEGSVLKADNSVRITAQLIDGRTDQHLWAQTFDRTLNQILNLQRDVASAIAAEIKWTLDPEDEAYFQERKDVNSDAYQLYLKGWHYRLKENSDGLAWAYKLFNQALELDSNLVQAEAAKVVTLFLGAGGSEENTFEEARRSARRAIALDPNAPEANLAMALFNELFILDFKGADKHFQQALLLRPGDAEIRREYGLYLQRLGYFDRSMAQLELSYASDPMSVLTLRDMGFVNLRLGNISKGFSQLSTSFEMDTENVRTAELMGVAYMLRGEFDRAIQQYDSLRTRYPTGFFEGEWIADQRAGRPMRALELIASLEDSSRSNWGPWGTAFQANLLGRHDVALGILSDLPKGWLYAIRESLLFDNLKAEPGYKQLLSNLGFPDVQVEPISNMIYRLHGAVPNS